MTDNVDVDLIADDARLARLAARGDAAAAARLVERYQGPVRAFLRRLTGDAHLADDLTQETLLRMLRHARRYDPRYPMKTWLLTIARRLWIDQMRQQGRRGRTLELATDPPDARAAEDRAPDSAERGRLLAAALDRLNVPQRSAVVLFYQQQMSIEQVAQTMRMTPNTIKSHLHRARARLRELLEPMRESVMP